MLKNLIVKKGLHKFHLKFVKLTGLDVTIGQVYLYAKSFRAKFALDLIDLYFLIYFC